MTLNRESGQVEMTCDDCGDASFGPEAVADEAVLRDDAKREGWRSFRRNSQWCHSCPDCVAVWKAERADERGHCGGQGGLFG